MKNYYEKALRIKGLFESEEGLCDSKFIQELEKRNDATTQDIIKTFMSFNIRSKSMMGLFLPELDFESNDAVYIYDYFKMPKTIDVINFLKFGLIPKKEEYIEQQTNKYLFVFKECDYKEYDEIIRNGYDESLPYGETRNGLFTQRTQVDNGIEIEWYQAEGVIARCLMVA